MENGRSDTIGLAEKIAGGGYVTVPQLADLKATSRTVIYEDVKAGLLPIEKFGRNTRVAATVARAYVPRKGLVAVVA